MRASLIAFLTFLALTFASLADTEKVELPDGRTVHIMPSPGPTVVVEKTINGFTLFGISFLLGLGVSWFMHRNK